MDPVQIASLAGALLILGAYAASELRRVRVDDLTYALLNTAGAGILAVVARSSASGASWFSRSPGRR